MSGKLTEVVGVGFLQAGSGSGLQAAALKGRLESLCEFFEKLDHRKLNSSVAEFFFSVFGGVKQRS